MLRCLPCRRGPILRERLEVIPAHAMFRGNLSLVQILQDFLSRSNQTVLIAVVPLPVRVPPENLSVIAAPDAIHMVYLPAPQIGVCLLAAPGVDVDRIVSQGQLHKVGPGGADAAQGFNAFHRLVQAQHPGDAPLYRNLVNDIRLGDAQLGLGRLQVVQHNGDGPQVLILRLHGKARQRVDSRRDIGLRFWYRFRGRGRVLVLHRCGRRLLLRLSAAARQSQEYPRRQYDRQRPFVHFAAAFLFLNCPYDTNAAGNRQGNFSEIPTNFQKTIPRRACVFHPGRV